MNISPSNVSLSYSNIVLYIGRFTLRLKQQRGLLDMCIDNILRVHSSLVNCCVFGYNNKAQKHDVSSIRTF